MFSNRRLDTNIKHIYVLILKNIFDTKQRYDLIQIDSMIIKHTYVLRFKKLFDYKTYIRFNIKETL